MSKISQTRAYSVVWSEADLVFWCFKLCEMLQKIFEMCMSSAS